MSKFWEGALMLLLAVWVAGAVAFSAYDSWKTDSVLNNNPNCVIERLQREVIDADGTVHLDDVVRECHVRSDS